MLFYSEIKPLYLQNIGYLAEQIDLYLSYENIGCCWYGVGKPDHSTMDGDLAYVIMLVFAKQPEQLFRKDVSKASRLPLTDIYSGSRFRHIVQHCRYAPSACNTQPWRVEDLKNGLAVYRVFRKRGIMKKNLVAYYHQIDLGIFLLFLDLSLEHEQLYYERVLYEDEYREESGSLTARYAIGMDAS